MTFQVNEPSAKYLVRPQSNNEGVGIPPSSWQIKPLGELSEFITSGSRGWASYYKEHGATFIRSQNVLKGQLDFNDHQCVVPPVGSEGSRTRVEFGDLLITITGNSVGNVAYVDRPLGEAYISQHVGLVRLKESESAAYICRFLSPGAPGNSQIVSNQSGQSKPGLNLKNLRDFVVSIPPKEEQRAIATALSDVDALIAGLEKLIAKKRDLKQAAMQQLLTGQTRLPGFSGEWNQGFFGDVVTALEAGVSVNSIDTEPTIDTPCVLKTSALVGGRFLPNEAKVIEARDIGRARTSVKGDTILISRMNTPTLVGEVAYVAQDFDSVYLPDRVWMVRFNASKNVNVQWMAFVLCSQPYRDLLREVATGTSGSMKNISKGALLSLPIQFPSSKEQFAIATVLSNMDAGLAILEIRLAKTRDLKQGMMQELLTGRTRFV